MLNAFLKAVAALVLGVIACTSAAAVDLKIGFVSTERVLRESAPAVRAQKKLEREFEKREADLKKMDRQIRDLQAILDRDAATMAEAERNNKVRELSNLSRDFQRSERSFRDDVNIRRNEELASLQERADKIIKQIADVEKFDLILQEPVVWASPRIDITDRVIKLLADK
ncbi:MAG: OmpH family outer membrane protein [Betaproteobacteria bacterium]|nr:OmpH family outer membrane protein [Betaproteobacteria bacterium]